MPEYAGPDEAELDQAPVVWPEPSRLDSWWHHVMTDPETGAGSAPTLTHNG
ncbi:hypothetical protein [Nocardia donostiensis]|uniref:hypothetical protein n=1 Tax=Nocardia donostiensis TaxID=1538463 RepID=UPI00158B0BC5|nr:hypothetical protein [Nocardia donostiensis]